MAEGTEVGKAYVSLEATDAGLSSGLKQGEAKVEQFAANTTKATGRASRGFAGLGKGIKDTIKPLTTLVGGVTAAVGTFSLFVSLGERIGRTIFGLNEKGQTRAEAGAEETSDAVRAALRKAAGVKPFSPQEEALYKRQAEIDDEITRQEQIAATLDTVPGVEGTAALTLPIERKKAQQRLRDLQSQRSDITGALQRLGGASRAGSAGLPPPIVGLGGGDPNAVLRELRAIRQEGMRRGSDE